MNTLQEQRKGEENNVIAFEQPQLATAPRPPGKDWLRDLPNGCRFLCRMNLEQGSALQWYGIASVQEKAVMLGTDHEFQPGHVKFMWVDSAKFSAQRTFVQVLPDMEAIEEGQPPE